MNDKNNQDRVYVLGHSAEELNRLIDQARLFGELTEDVFVRAGIGAGMRVLDVGCGAGDVSFLLARMVGSSGAVVGVDRSEEAVARATARARAMGLAQVSFSQGEIEDISLDQPVDAAVGRFVLMYSPEPSIALRRVAANVRAGGIVAFQEMNVEEAKSFPRVDLFEQSMRLIVETLDREKAENLMGLRLYRTFVEAGLPPPQMIMGARVEGSSDSLGYQIVAHVVKSLLPVMEKLGIANEKEIQVETLTQRLRDEVVSRGAVIVLPPLVGAWTRTLQTNTG
ncbi:MAG TPA: class I SAM-dependent methyltransferase [Candidatus Udaeobacter sp.]|nr:class I SAM-dependent methyltransferase [Candidatus Udaeobacter sp.]